MYRNRVFIQIFVGAAAVICFDVSSHNSWGEPHPLDGSLIGKDCTDYNCQAFCERTLTKSGVENWVCEHQKCLCNPWPKCPRNYCVDKCKIENPEAPTVDGYCNGPKSCKCVLGCTHASCKEFCIKDLTEAGVQSWACENTTCRCNPYPNCTKNYCKKKCQEDNPGKQVVDSFCSGPENCTCIAGCTHSSCKEFCVKNLTEAGVESWACESNTCKCNPYPNCTKSYCNKKCQENNPGNQVVESYCSGPQNCTCVLGCTHSSCKEFCIRNLTEAGVQSWACESNTCRCNPYPRCTHSSCKEFCIKDLTEARVQSWACENNTCRCNPYPNCTKNYCKKKCQQDNPGKQVLDSSCSGPENCTCMAVCTHSSCKEFCIKDLTEAGVQSWACDNNTCRCNPYSNCTKNFCNKKCQQDNPGKQVVDSFCSGPEKCTCMAGCTHSSCKEFCVKNLTEAGVESWACESNTCKCNPYPSG